MLQEEQRVRSVVRSICASVQELDDEMPSDWDMNGIKMLFCGVTLASVNENPALMSSQGRRMVCGA
jgi:hypothetical protein